MRLIDGIRIGERHHLICKTSICLANCDQVFVHIMGISNEIIALVYDIEDDSLKYDASNKLDKEDDREFVNTIIPTVCNDISIKQRLLQI